MSSWKSASCAASAFLCGKCTQDCEFPQHFACVHKKFGATYLLKELLIPLLRKEAEMLQTTYSANCQEMHQLKQEIVMLKTAYLANEQEINRLDKEIDNLKKELEEDQEEEEDDSPETSSINIEEADEDDDGDDGVHAHGERNQH